MFDMLAFSRLDCAQRSQLNKKMGVDANLAFLTIISGSLLLCKLKLRVQEYR